LPDSSKVKSSAQDDPHAKGTHAFCDQETRQKKAAVLAVAHSDLAGLGRKKPKVGLLVFGGVIYIADMLYDEPLDDHGTPVEIAGSLGGGKTVFIPELTQDLLHDDVVLEGYPFPYVGGDRLPPADDVALSLDGRILKNQVSFPVVPHDAPLSNNYRSFSSAEK
jgi:hypothetical protein